MGKHVYYIEYKQFLVKDGVYSEYLSVFLFYSYVSIAIKALSLKTLKSCIVSLFPAAFFL